MIDPLLRGIYYLYLGNFEFIFCYKDPDAHVELISVARELNMHSDWGSIVRYKYLFVRELERRYGG